MGNLILSSPDIMKLITETIQCGTNKLNAVLLATSSADPFYFKNFILTNINTPNFGAFLDGRIKINSVAGVEAIATAEAEAEAAEAEAAEAEPEELTTTRIKWDPEDYQQPSHLEFMWSRCGKGANLLWNSCGKTGRAA